MNDCLAIQDKKEETFLYRIFISHPELNASAVARRMGISQSLMSQYISGIKKPSQEREALIVVICFQISIFDTIGNNRIYVTN